MTLREEIRKQAKEVSDQSRCLGVSVEIAESAILAGIRLVLERDPSEEMLDVGADAYFQKKQELGQKTPIGPLLEYAHRAMTAQLLKELGKLY